MAILQISRITQRKGLMQDLPQPLAGAELGWAVDERRLFIGNGELAEGAPVVGNTEILTEFSDLLGGSTTYTFKGDVAGYTAQTGPTPGTPVSQSLQQRLDSFVVVTDFGAVGDGVTDDTAAINRALFQLYCRQSNPQVRRGLYFPAGEYIVTNTLLIPPYARLYGDGASSSIINFEVNAWSNTVPYAAGVLVSYSGGYRRAKVDVPIGEAITDATYWEVATLPSFVAQLSDSLQQTGDNIGTTGATAPRNVEIADMSFTTNMNASALLVEQAIQVYVDRCNFVGPLSQDVDISTATADIAAVRWRSTTTNVCKQVSFNDCVFSGWSYGSDSDQNIKGITFNECDFDFLYRGIVWETGGSGSPTGVRVTNSNFDRIYAQGIVIDGAELNVSAYNVFYDVGNNLLGVLNPQSSIIEINANNNVSIGDMFERTTALVNASGYPRISLLNNNTSIALGMNVEGIEYNIDGAVVDNIANQLELGDYTRTSAVKSELANSSTDTLFDVDATEIKAFCVDYTMVVGSAFRTGKITVVTGTGFSYTDDYTENTTTDTTLAASQVGSTVTVSYTNSGLTDGQIHYSITHLA